MKVERTTRGFEFIRHEEEDGEGRETRLVGASSAVGDYPDSLDRPGSSYLWIGKHHHLNREEVAELAAHLTRWVETGSLDEKPSDERDNACLSPTPFQKGEVIIPATRRVKRLLLRPEDFWLALIGDLKFVLQGMPSDATLVYTTYDWQTHTIALFLESQEFEEVPKEEIPPLFHMLIAYPVDKNDIELGASVPPVISDAAS